MKISELMRTPIIVSNDSVFIDVLKCMIEDKTNSVLVIDEDGKLCGEVSVIELIKEILPDYIENDSIAAHFATEDIFIIDANKAKDKPVSKFMEDDIKTIHVEASLMEAAVIALEHRQGRIPVVDDDKKPIGVLTRTEVKNIIGEALGLKPQFKSKE